MQEQSAAAPAVYAAINAVTGRLAKVGIAKDRKNESQGYSFRGIDDVYNALSSLLSEEGLCILPKVISREVTERQTRSGSSLFYVCVNVEFTFVASKDGSIHVVTMPGEAMDSGDKATNKAISAAYKYCCLTTFCIPTQGDNDADATTHDIVADGKTATVVVAVETSAKSKTEGKTVTEVEVEAITALCHSTGVTLDQICLKHAIPFIEMLPLSKTAEVISRLQHYQ